MEIVGKMGSFASRFAFELFLETLHDSIIKGLRKYLEPITEEDIPGMVRDCRFPPYEHLDFSAVSDNVEHIKKISLLRLMEFIAEARPDLAMVIQNMGEAGAVYLAQLRVDLISRIGQGASGQDFKSKREVAMAHCDECGNQWPVDKAEASTLTECPFCVAGGGGGNKPPLEGEQ